jgi:D-serine deaminase-like pyridoxal phosphate-dependent protein
VNPAERGPTLIAALDDAGVHRPCALVDLDAFDANLDRLLQPLHGEQTLRVASKSIRVPALLRRALKHERVQGILGYHVAEVALLEREGLLGELGPLGMLVAYPPGPHDVARYAALTAATETPIWSVVDGPEAVRALGKAGQDAGVDIQVCIDLDLSLRPAGRLHLGVRRSPIRSVADATALARTIQGTPGVELSALLGYEAQIAGIQDHAGAGLLGKATDLVMKGIKARSRALVLERRAAVVDALTAMGVSLQVVNGGGTGSVDFTSTDRSITEIAAGSGLLCPHLFDGYAGLDLQPAAFFALSVVRRSDAGFATVFGGGWVASGSAGPDRLPQPWWPAVDLLGLEGAGEVQTPLVGDLQWGDTVLFRHAKSGELFEHTAEVALIQQGKVVDVVPTYRGLGSAFG